MKNNNKALIRYTVAVFISLCAYEIYSMYLSKYNMGFALAAFEFITFLTFRFAYSKFERRILKGLTIRDGGFKMTTLEALKKRPFVLMAFGLMSFGEFAIMLPHLHSSQNAMLFVLFYSISSVLRIPFAQKIFGDKIDHPLHYNIGLTIILFAGLAIQFKGGILAAQFDFDLGLLGALLIKLVLNIFDSIYERKVTTAEFAGAKQLSVAAIEEVKTYFTIVGGLLTGIYLYNTNPDFHRVLPTLNELGAIFLIGIVCNAMSAVSIQLNNIISHIRSQPIQAIRPLIAFLPLLLNYFYTGSGGNEVLYQSICLGFTVIGILICLKSAPPANKVECQNNLQTSA